MDTMRDKTSTIYAIRCKNNGKLYIGKTTKLNERIQAHFSELKNGKHSVKAMIDDFNKYGKDGFEIYILEENVTYENRQKEYEYMRMYNSFDEKYGYNRGDKKKKEVKKFNYIYSLPPNLYNKQDNQSSNDS